MRISTQHFNTSQMTDTNSLANALLTKPATIGPVITHLGGKQDQRFPLTMLTEGVGNVSSIDELEYEYRIKTHVDETRPIASEPANTVDLGKGGQTFTLTFPDKWFIKDYVLRSKSGAQVRIMSQPVPNGSHYDYTVQIVDPDPAAYVPADDVKKGSRWAQMFAPVGTDFSRGNASNWVTPGKVRHKLTTIRKSYQMSGNAINQVVSVELPIGDGRTTRFWMDYEEWQHMMNWKAEFERALMYGKQSYNENGQTPLRDENGQPIVIGPGLLQQVVNKDTYSVLTTDKLSNTIGDLFYGMSDAQNKQVTLYTGTGGAREFDRAMKEELGSQSYTVVDSNHFVSGTGSNLELGGYFTSYKHIDGHVIRVVKVPYFDDGPVAQTAPKHPKTGYSLESYRMLFIDQSNYDGKANLHMVNKKKRELIRWAVAGSTIPRGYQGNSLRASDIDGASVHFLKTAGILLRRFDTSLDLQCVAS